VTVSFCVKERFNVQHLNFHHLHYFWAVARDGNLTRTAKALRVSQSALSAQIRQLEEQLGESLFHREGRGLVLSEAGRIVLGYADDIFAAGGELVATLKEGRRREHVLRVGAVATLSRNFQESFVRPLLDEPTVRLRIQSGRLDDLLDELIKHELDLVLSNRPAHRSRGRAWRCRRIARQKVSIIGRPRSKPFRFSVDLPHNPIIVPGPDSEVRTEFDALCEQRSIKPSILAEVDDMATMRLLVRDTEAVALLPAVVVRDEIRSGLLRELCVVPGLFETFYAITVDRHYQHPLLRSLLARDESEILAMDEAEPETK
jgi:LysR family transcriptional activator of nhaA